MNKDTLDAKAMFGPLLSRMLAEGVNPFDIERVSQNLNPISLLDNWERGWLEISANYERIAKEAEIKGQRVTARELYWHASMSYRAGSLVHFQDLERKEKLVSKYVECYQKSVSYFDCPVERVEIPFRDTSIPGYLHLPKSGGTFPCSIVFGGIDSGKEEMHTLCRPLVERGISALALDLPGSGESIFFRGITLRIQNVLEALSNAITYLNQRREIDKDRIGVTGGCMGTNFAYRIAAADERVRFCVLWMPIISLSFIDLAMIPVWMREGPWIKYLTGLENTRIFAEEMTLDMEKEIITCPLYMVHGTHDNWIPTSYMQEIYNRAKGSKKLLIIEEEPAFSSGYFVTHTMPVVEQMHWVRYLMADWINEQVS